MREQGKGGQDPCEGMGAVLWMVLACTCVALFFMAMLILSK